MTGQGSPALVVAAEAAEKRFWDALRAFAVGGLVVVIVVAAGAAIALSSARVFTGSAAIVVVVIASASVVAVGLTVVVVAARRLYRTDQSIHTPDSRGWGGLFAGWITAFIVVLLSMSGAVWFLGHENALTAEVAITMVIVAAVVILLMVLGFTALIFRRLALTTREHAMGLPEGSVRAIIALLLIVIFAIIAVFLVANLDRQARESRVMEGLTVEQADALPSSEVLSRKVEARNSDDEPTRFTVVLRGQDAASKDLSQQLMTTLGTLVVAVAAFYFGSQAVQTAKSNPTPTAVAPVEPIAPTTPATPAPSPPVPTTPDGTVEADTVLTKGPEPVEPAASPQPPVEVDDEVQPPMEPSPPVAELAVDDVK